MRARTAAALCALFFLVCTRARADEARRVLVLVEQPIPALLSRIAAELASSGFGVALATTSSFPPNRRQIEDLAGREHATVGLVVAEAGAGAEFWLIDPATGKTTFREVLLGLYDPRESPEVIAIRVVEALRATLLDTEHPRAAAIDIASRPAPERASIGPAPAPRFTLAIGGGGAYSAGGVPPVGHLDLAITWAITPRFGLAVDGALTPARASLHGPEGEANVGFYLAGLSFRFCATNPSAPVQLRSGAGAWVAVMSFVAEPSAAYVNTSSELVSVVPHLDLGLRAALTARLGLALGVSGGVSAPGASILFAGRQVATWGRPIWLGSIALEAPLD